MRNHLGLDIKAAGADSAYGASMIYRAVGDMGISLYTLGTISGVIYKVEFRREEFQHNEQKGGPEMDAQFKTPIPK